MDLLSRLLRDGLTRLMKPVAEAAQCKAFARELELLMHKACFGRLPEGTYLRYTLYTRHLTREQLCPLMMPDMLAQMDACTQVSRRELHCRMLSHTIDEKTDQSAAVTLGVTLHFDGCTKNGQPVAVHMENKRLIASMVIDQTYGWKLMELTAAAGELMTSTS